MTSGIQIIIKKIFFLKQQEETKPNKHKKVLDIDIAFREDHRSFGRRDRRDGERRGDRGDRPPRRDFERRGPPRDREDRKRNNDADGEKEEGSGRPFRGGLFNLIELFLRLIFINYLKSKASVVVT